ncbi:MAG: M28 family peptidase [Thermoplasmatota archaeon]
MHTASNPRLLFAVVTVGMLLGAGVTGAISQGSGPPALSTSVETVMDGVNESAIRGYIETIQGYGPHTTGSDACRELKRYLAGELRGAGLQVSLHNWTRGGYQGQNIVATLPGIRPDGDIFIVSAHYDSAPTSPGADDDGSGVAACLAMAHALSGYSFNATVRFVLFSGEEQGTLGSLSYARDMYHGGERITGVFNLDGIGHNETASGAHKVIVYEEASSAWLGAALDDVAALHPELAITPVRLPNTGYSDHNSFLAYGYEALQLEEYEYNDRFHTPNDTIDRVNTAYVTRIARLVAGSLVTLAENGKAVQASFVSPERDALYVFGAKLLTLDRGFVLGLGRLTFTVEVTAGDPVEEVTFYLDGGEQHVDRDAPYEWTCRQLLLWNHRVAATVDAGDGRDVVEMDVGLHML